MAIHDSIDQKRKHGGTEEMLNGNPLYKLQMCEHDTGFPNLASKDDRIQWSLSGQRNLITRPTYFPLNTN